jgi:hypothetical protein
LKVSDPSKFKILERAFDNEYSSIIFTHNEPTIDNLSEQDKELLIQTTIRYYGYHSVFIISHQNLQDFLFEKTGRLDTEIESEGLFIIRKDNPILLEFLGGSSDIHNFWRYFEEHRFNNLKEFKEIPTDEKLHLLVLDENCSESEIDNINLWNSFKESNIFGDSFSISSKTNQKKFAFYSDLWNIKQDCGLIFVRRLNSVTFDKYLVKSSFVGKFTLDDFTRKLLKNSVERYIVSQSYADVQGEEDYRLVGENIDSTIEQMQGNILILFYSLSQIDLDRKFKKLNEEKQTNCNKEASECSSDKELLSLLTKTNTHLFSINLSMNDLPSFMIEKVPTLLLFKENKDHPEEFEFKNFKELQEKLKEHLKDEERIDRDL